MFWNLDGRPKNGLHLWTIFFVATLALWATSAGQLQDQDNFNFTVVDPASDGAPVSVTFTWDPLDRDMEEISYTINITDNGALINSTTVNSTMTTVKDLPSCLNLMATLVATNASNITVVLTEMPLNFTTMDNAPTSLTLSGGPLEAATGTSVVLNCTWDPPVYYVAWYKDGVLISSEDLASGTTLMPPSIGAVSSSFDDGMSLLTIMNSNFNDSGNYTCAVSCGARNVEFSMIDSNLTSSIIVAVYEQPQVPDGFQGRVIEDGSSPTVSFEWMLLDTTEDGIPPEGSRGLQYIVTVKNGGSVVDNSTVDDPMNSTTFTGLPSCTNLTGILVATNGLLTSMETNTTVQVTESTTPMPSVTSEDNEACVSSPASVTLQCSWSGPSYYVAWYKDGGLIYSEDLSVPNVLMEASDGFVVESGYSSRTSTLTIMSSSIDDSGNYTCAVGCGARNVSFDDIPPEVTDYIMVSVYDVPEAPGNFSGMVVMADMDPVTVMFTWDGLVGEGATGIPSNGDQSLNYTVSIDSTSTTVTTSMEMIEVTNLTSCTEYSATLMASNKVNTGPSTAVNFTTTEKVSPMPNVTSEDNETCVSSPANVTLQCSWSSPSYYVAWYKDGGLIYSEDLSVPDVLMEASDGFVVDSSYSSRISTLTILSSSIDDSGNYTCAVSCGARNDSFDDIPPEVTDYIVVSVYDVPEAPDNFSGMVVIDDTDPVTVMFTWDELVGENATGIPSNGDQSLNFTLCINFFNIIKIKITFNVTTSMEMIEVTDLASCTEYSATLMASNKVNTGPSTTANFTTTEKVSPMPNVTSENNETCVSSPANVTLQCSWSSLSYYVAWYKDGGLIYSEDLSVPNVTMEASDGLVVESNYSSRTSTLTILSSSIDDSGNYTCAVGCGAINTRFGDIPPEVTDYIMVSVYDVPEAPANFSGMVVMDDMDPVTVMFTWDELVGEGATGIPSNGDPSLNYTVSIDGTATTVTTSMEMIEVTNLASCTEYSATLMASNKVNTGPSTTVNFTTTEKVPPLPVVSSSDLVNCTIAPNNITLQCDWSTASYHVAWYKDGVLISSEDLANDTTLMSPSIGVVSSSFDDRMSVLTIMNSNFNDSGNYTCAVSCGARDVEFDNINSTLLDTIQVLVFERPSEPRNVNEELGYLRATISWTQPESFGVPDPLSPDGLVWYVVQVTRDDTGVVVIPERRVYHPNTSTVVNLNFPCENYTVTVRVENKAGASMNVTRMFTLVESDAVTVSLDPMGPLEHNFTASNSNINITLNCTWDPRAYYLLWTVDNSSQDSRNVFAINLVTKVMDVTVPMDLPISVTYDADNRYSVLTITDAFISDSGNYTCSVTCDAERVMDGVLERVPEISRETREVIVQAVPENLISVNRQSSYIVVQWTAPPPPFTGNYLLTYSYLNGSIIDSTSVSGTTHNITNLPSFTMFVVEVRANNGPVREFGPAVIGSFSTLPRIVVVGGTPPPLTVVEKGDGTHEVVTINIPNVEFADSSEALSHIWVVCIRNRDDNLGNPDSDYPNNDTFGFYGDAGNGVPYIVSEFGVDEFSLPRVFRVGDTNQANDFPTIYVNGRIDGNDVLDCFIRYFITLDDPPSGNNRRRRAAGGVRQYDLFVSSGYIQVSEPFSRRALIAGLVVTVFIILILIGVIAAIIVIFFLYRRKYKKEGYGLPPERQGSVRLRDNIPLSFLPTTDVIQSEARRPVPIKSFEKYVAQRHRNSDQIFSEEYELLSIKSPTLSHNVGLETYNVPKNRYANIHSSDATRVVLSSIEGMPGSDYINANYIDGYKTPNAYIAAQGPMVNTAHDFWRMVWEQNSKTVVMLTNLVEKTRVKCHQYWPEPVGSSVTFSKLTVTLIDMQSMADVVLRTFHITKEGEKGPRQIQHIHYTSWPDFGVPEQSIPILKLIERTESLNPVGAGPIIAHCSAGVGRTGTLIVISNMIKMIEDVGTVDIFNSILHIRGQRTYMVQTEKQYMFVHEALVEYLKVRGHVIPVKSLKKKYEQLKEQNPQSGLSGIYEEYGKLESIENVDDTLLVSATLPANLAKNRHKDSVPYDPYRVRLTMFPGVEGSDYINSTYLDGYQQRNQFILAQGPLEHTIFDFWRMVWETRASSIVMLCSLVEDDYEQCVKYWPSPEEGVMQYGAFLIETESETEYPSGFVTREISLTNTKHYSERRVLRHFHFKEWPESNIPTSASSVIDLIGLVIKSQMQHGGGPVVMHDSGAVGRAATFCALCVILETLKSERIVDVFRTVRSMRLRQPRAVASPELYGFLYQTAVEYLDSFDHYANFD